MAKISSISMSDSIWAIAKYMMRRGGYGTFSEYVRDLIRRDHRQAVEEFEAAEKRRIEEFEAAEKRRIEQSGFTPSAQRSY